MTLLPKLKPKQFRRTHIRAWREFRELTQEQLGERISMTPSNLSMLERGQRGYTQETMEKIAAALSTDVASLLSRDPSESSELWGIWEKALPSEKTTITEIAAAVLRTRVK